MHLGTNFLQWIEATPPEIWLICAGIFFAVLLLFTALLRQHFLSKHQQSSQFWQQEKYQLTLANELLEQSLTQSTDTFEKDKNAWQQRQAELRSQIESQQQLIGKQEHSLGILSQKANQLSELQLMTHSLREQLLQSQDELNQLKASSQSQQASFAQERKAFDEKITLLQNAEVQLKQQFENLANAIFEQKAEKFNQSSAQGLHHLLSPLKQQIEDFKKQIGDQYLKEGQERAALKSEILGLKELNLQITQEAAALTNALKGDNKQQGNWGEVVLSRILEESGLREGHEYEIQKQLSSQQGKAFRPDVVVHLPNNKDIVIDSKVSLLAHEKAVNAKNDISRKQALKEHVNSIKGHIKGLSKKDYQDLSGVETLDYVLMFIPIETAFLNAVEEAPELIKMAMDNQIMLVSPTNLLVALRTINNIWQYEYQNQNAKVIAEKAKRMYDKFAGFVDDMDKIGKQIDALERSYDSAMNKLSSGKGNLLTQAESFKSLGVTPNKILKTSFLNAPNKAANDVQDNDEQ